MSLSAYQISLGFPTGSNSRISGAGGKEKQLDSALFLKSTILMRQNTLISSALMEGNGNSEARWGQKWGSFWGGGLGGGFLKSFFQGSKTRLCWVNQN